MRNLSLLMVSEHAKNGATSPEPGDELGRDRVGEVDVMVGELGHCIMLTCGGETGGSGQVEWMKNNVPLLRQTTRSESVLGTTRFSFVNSSALLIQDLRAEDEGVYTCHQIHRTKRNEPIRREVNLVSAGGPDAMSLEIYPSAALANGTLYVLRGTNVTFNCSSWSHPPAYMAWIFTEPGIEPDVFVEKNGTFVFFSMRNIVPNYQGNYTCTAMNPSSGHEQASTIQLLVYYPPTSLPRCSAEAFNASAEVRLTCAWPGGYPEPTLSWRHDEMQLKGLEPPLNVLGVGNHLTVALNSSGAYEGKRFKCVGSHIGIGDRRERSCTIILRAPVPQSRPMETCFLGGKVTLTCQSVDANPPATITWLKTIAGTKILPSSKYIISQEGQASSLTITNCSMASDQGYYICKTQNPLAVKEIEIWLTVKGLCRGAYVLEMNLIEDNGSDTSSLTLNVSDAEPRKL
nr:PREDICTED: V-set and immunoglobulin domain-containing protein 10 isoform X1 [Latimeria chalumnae]|eukprot:XP_014342319.1 PREDICTED: V-set and immunoglobulin domain-containing protein 10 isoform X1 [Latimeria chalumnae]